MEDFSFKLKTSYLQLCLYYKYFQKANPTGQLLEVQLLRDLFRDWRHLLQKLLVLVVCAIGG
jgi:hypothetical protein